MASLTDLKKHLNKSGSTSDDTELQRFLNDAQAIVSNMIDGGVEESVVASRGTVVLRRRPAGAVTLTTPAGVAVSGFVVDADAGLLRDVPYVGALTVSYGARVPNQDVVDTAELMIAARLWETQRGTTPSPLGEDGAPFTPGLGGILTEVRSLLLAAGEQPFAGIA